MAIQMAYTEHGIIQGRYAGDNKITVFKGIPYAKPPIGELRWKAPEPPVDWEGVLQASDYAKIPIQPVRPKGSMYQQLYFPVNLPQSEDCLYLNIWTPADKPEAKLPVAVWIFGGGYTTGYANKIEFDGEAIAKRGCIFVSFNYRMGLMGYLAHPELAAEDPEGLTGNYGLMDQIAAVQWVHENISAFGGDPDNVTIFGQSAGAMSCMNLACSPQAEGLFHRAICESCGGMNIEFYRGTPTIDNAKKNGIHILEKMKLTHISEARAMNPQELMRRLMDSGLAGAMLLQPCVDGHILPENVFDAVMNNTYQKIDFMIGSTSNEGYGFNEGKIYSPEETRRKAELCFGEEAEAYLKVIGYDPDGVDWPTDSFGDNMLSGNTSWNELELRRGGNTYYQYYFTKTIPGVESGAFHSAEHAYIFQTLNRFDLPYQGSDYELSNHMADYWCNFIKTGDPNGAGLPRWEKYQSDSNKILELGDNIRMREIPDIPGAAFTVDYILRMSEKRNKKRK